MIVRQVLEFFFPPMISLQIYGHLFMMDIWDNDILGSHIESKFMYICICLFRLNWVMTQRGYKYATLIASMSCVLQPLLQL